MSEIIIPINTEKVIVDEIMSDKFDRTFIVQENSHIILVLYVRIPSHGTISVRQTGSNSSVKIIGITYVSKNSSIEFHTRQLHEAENTKSDLLVRSVVDDGGLFSFHGLIRIEKNAQKSDAYQRNENILLSAKAQVHTVPILEILANDVRCTHGATVGPISAEQLWYLESRGITRMEARQLILNGFLASALDTIPDKGVKEKIYKKIQLFE